MYIFKQRKKEGSLCERLILVKNKIEEKTLDDKITFAPDIINGTTGFDVLLSEQKKAINEIKLKSKPGEFSKYLDTPSALLSDFTMFVYVKKHFAISEEICSGLVKAGDIREVSGSTSFLKETPMDVCHKVSGSWTDACDFKSISVEEVKNEITRELDTK